MRLKLFATTLLVAMSEAISLDIKDAAQLDSSMTPELQLLAQTEQLTDMATEIAQTRKEQNDSDKKHMGE